MIALPQPAPPPERIRQPEENDLTPELIRRGVDAYLVILDNDLRIRDVQPLIERGREEVVADLIRAPLMVYYHVFPYLRDRTIDQLTGISDIFFVHITRLRIGQSDTLRRYPVSLGRYTYIPSSLAGMFYIRNIQLELLRGGERDDSIFLNSHVPTYLWLPATDDVSRMHQAYLDTLAYVQFRDLDPSVWNLAIRVARALHDVGTVEYRLGLLARLRENGLLWSSLFQEWVRDQPTPLVATLDDVVAVLEVALEGRAGVRFGPGTRASREAIDRRHRATQQLSPACDFWTYEELEHWARWTLRSLSVVQLCAITREQKSLFELLGVVELDEPCEQIPHNEIVAVIERAIRTSPKRGLCRLLAQYATPPQPVRWSSQRWYNVDVLEAYLPPESVALLLSEVPVEGERFIFRSAQGGGSAAFHVTQRDADWTLIENFNILRGYVAWDLYRQMLRINPDLHDFRTYFSFRREQMGPTDQARIVMTSENLDAAYPAKSWVAVVVLRGLLLVSLVGTNQTITKVGGEIVAEEHFGRLVPPQRLALQAGDALVATLGEAAVDEGVIAPFDEFEFYDFLVFRAMEEGTVWLEYGMG